MRNDSFFVFMLYRVSNSNGVNSNEMQKGFIFDDEPCFKLQRSKF